MTTTPTPASPVEAAVLVQIANEAILPASYRQQSPLDYAIKDVVRPEFVVCIVDAILAHLSTLTPAREEAEPVAWREAAKPFVEAADAYVSFDGQHDFPDHHVIARCGFTKLTVGHLRALQDALYASPPPAESAATKCFECQTELHAPFCPACNPEMVRPAESAAVSVEEIEEAVRLAEVGEYLLDAKAFAAGNGYTEPRELRALRPRS